jgi:hypothetical protein
MIDATLYHLPSCRLERELDDQANDSTSPERSCRSGGPAVRALLTACVERRHADCARPCRSAGFAAGRVSLHPPQGHMFDSTRGTVASWVYQVAYSKSLNRRNRYMVKLPVRGLAIDAATHIADSESGPERATEKLSARKAVRLAVLELTEALRETLYLFFFEGYSLLEVGRKRNESFGNTRHHFYRGMAALRPLLAHVQTNYIPRPASLATMGASTRGKRDSAEVSCADFF